MKNGLLVLPVLAVTSVMTGCSFSFNTDNQTPPTSTDGTVVPVTTTVTAEKPVQQAPAEVKKTEPVISANTTAEKPAEVTKVTNIDQIIGTWRVVSGSVPGGENVITLMKAKSYYAITIGGKAYDSGYWSFAGNSLILHTNAGGDIQPMAYVGLDLYGNDELHLIDSPFTKAQVWQRVK